MRARRERSILHRFVPPATSALYRVFFGFLFLFIAAFWKKEIRIIPAKNLFWILLCGVIFSIDLLVWHKSIFFIGPGLSTVIGNFQVFILAAFGILFFGEKIHLRFLCAIPVAVLGLFLVVGIDRNALSQDYKTGIYFALLTALFYAGFLLCLRKIHNEQNQPSFFYSLMLISFVAAICLALEMVLSGNPFVIPDMHNLAILLSLAFFSQVLGWLLITNAMPKIRTSLTGFILLLQPALCVVQADGAHGGQHIGSVNGRQTVSGLKAGDRNSRAVHGFFSGQQFTVVVSLAFAHEQEGNL